MAEDTQSEDYKVLQAMRTEISGLVESKNTLDLEIKKLEEDKAQAELEFSAVDSKLKDVSGEWSNKMRELIDKENQLNELEISLTTKQSQFDTSSQKREEGIKYLEVQAKENDEVIKQRLNESAKKEVELKATEQRLGDERADLDKKTAQMTADREVLAQLGTDLGLQAIEIDKAKITLSKEEAKLRHEAIRLREFEGNISKGSSEALAEVAKKEENLRQREGMMEDRERKLEQEKATMSLRITKREAEDVERMKNEVVEKTNTLYRERSQFEIDVKDKQTELYNINEEIKGKRSEVSLLEGKLADIERREKGVGDTEAGLVAREKQLMFEIAKFKKRVKDAKMEETINESG